MPLTGSARHFRRWLAPLLVFVASVGVLHLRAQTGGPPAAAGDGTPAFVGSQRCAACHRRESEAWSTSQHAHALQPATERTVLGDFADARFERDGRVTAFRKRDGRFMIETPGADGKTGEFEMKFTLGLYPLQQYLVELSGGRLQAFGIAWDTRPATAGGQRWFDLYPGQKLAPGDPLHWTGIQQTANFMCIDCHVTDFRKGYDAAAGAYRSTWSEAGVGCEACHGPGSAHLANPQVKLPAHFPPRSRDVWGTDPATRPDVPREGRTVEVESCARCHARRSQLTDAYHAGQPFGDGFHATLLDRGVYRVDGQMQDEVFNYGSFLQSRMFAKGVSCGDCHDPHTQKLRAEGNAVCEQCHAAAKYDSRAHHFHDPASKAGQCASCHMPVVTYMIVDPRHDHSFRVPRPDLADSLGVPDVCAGCHSDRPKAWAARELEKRLGHVPSGFQTFAEAFHAADREAPGAAGLLARIANDGAQPAIVRASAIARSNGLDPPLAGIDLRRALSDPDPLLRAAAAEAIAAGGASPWMTALVPLLRDPVRGVRIEAARALAGPTELRLSQSDRESFRRALDEYIAVQTYNADRGEAHMNLALLEIRRGNTLLADDHLARAVAVDPGFVPAYVQRADLYRARRDEPAAERILREALGRNPMSALAHFQLGLSLVRQRRGDAALEELRRATDLEPATARYGYVYAVALEQAGQPAEARSTLERVLARHPYDVEALTAAAIWSIRRGDTKAALDYLMTLRALRPDDRGIAQEIERLQRTSPR
ncbi:tetratricopeptide repeat protein [Enhydrobacter sp.]|jgi:predicted CXXCH cytochrome family protein|uniref:tetratricopeptide repeat protein n=1 Tax=Enhydrobacter sp. TaxID=1894999 RepID=UPI00260A7BD7|nr:tetratricopeptide repeat protein [Enhydrobacter sp.]WIM14101.1 MAG: putative deca-heme c-type cytochrome [Enhydrobacter sp.]